MLLHKRPQECAQEEVATRCAGEGGGVPRALLTRRLTVWCCSAASCSKLTLTDMAPGELSMPIDSGVSYAAMKQPATMMHMPSFV